MIVVLEVTAAKGVVEETGAVTTVVVEVVRADAVTEILRRLMRRRRSRGGVRVQSNPRCRSQGTWRHSRDWARKEKIEKTTG